MCSSMVPWHVRAVALCASAMLCPVLFGWRSREPLNRPLANRKASAMRVVTHRASRDPGHLLLCPTLKPFTPGTLCNTTSLLVACEAFDADVQGDEGCTGASARAVGGADVVAVDARSCGPLGQRRLV